MQAGVKNYTFRQCLISYTALFTPCQVTVGICVLAHLQRVIPERYLDDKTIYHLQPSGNFVIGGPQVCGYTCTLQWTLHNNCKEARTLQYGLVYVHYTSVYMYMHACVLYVT